VHLFDNPHSQWIDHPYIIAAFRFFQYLSTHAGHVTDVVHVHVCVQATAFPGEGTSLMTDYVLKVLQLSPQRPEDIIEGKY
jgi:hypothetical protein